MLVCKNTVWSVSQGCGIIFQVLHSQITVVQSTPLARKDSLKSANRFPSRTVPLGWLSFSSGKNYQKGLQFCCFFNCQDPTHTSRVPGNVLYARDGFKSASTRRKSLSLLSIMSNPGLLKEVKRCRETKSRMFSRIMYAQAWWLTKGWNSENLSDSPGCLTFPAVS